MLAFHSKFPRNNTKLYSRIVRIENCRDTCTKETTILVRSIHIEILLTSNFHHRIKSHYF